MKWSMVTGKRLMRIYSLKFTPFHFPDLPLPGFTCVHHQVWSFSDDCTVALIVEVTLPFTSLTNTSYSLFVSVNKCPNVLTWPDSSDCNRLDILS